MDASRSRSPAEHYRASRHRLRRTGYRTEYAPDQRRPSSRIRRRGRSAPRLECGLSYRVHSAVITRLRACKESFNLTDFRSLPQASRPELCRTEIGENWVIMVVARALCACGPVHISVSDDQIMNPKRLGRESASSPSHNVLSPNSVCQLRSSSFSFVSDWSRVQTDLSSSLSWHGLLGSIACPSRSFLSRSELADLIYTHLILLRPHGSGRKRRCYARALRFWGSRETEARCCVTEIAASTVRLCVTGLICQRDVAKHRHRWSFIGFMNAYKVWF